MKTVLITGASSGFGEATARLLAKHKYKLVLVARRKERLEKLANELKVPHHIGIVDVRNRKKVEKFIEGIPNEFRPIDVLINNAGLALGRELVDQSNLDDWETMIDTNIKGLLYFTREILPQMKKRNSGHIINMGSVAGHVPYKGGNVYGATKAFVQHFSRNLRAETAEDNIRVTNIEPGMAETEFSIVRYKGDRAKADAVYEGTRSLTAQDIAETIQWIIERPAHVNIDNIEIMPVSQTYGGVSIIQKKK